MGYFRKNIEKAKGYEPGFQPAEFMLEHGFVDMIVHRRDLRSEIARLIDYCQK